MTLSRCLAALAATAVLAVAAGAAALTWEEAEREGLRVAAVRVAAGDVFDPALPDERHWLGALANAIHLTTRERVVRSALLFGPGEPARASVVHESERRLRALPWLIDAWIEPRPAGPGTVDALVHTHDGWSLSLGVKYNHAGGDAVWSVSVEEDNLLGLGKRVAVKRAQELDRDKTELAYRDDLLLGTPWRLEAAWQDLSDGRGRRLLLERPFESLAAPWSAGLETSATEYDLTRYQAGEGVYSFPVELVEARLSWRRRYRLRDREARRAGVELYAARTGYGELSVERPGVLPNPALEPRRLRGLLATWEISEDRFATFRNLRSVGNTEDVNLGWEATLKAGWLGRALGGDRDAWYAEGSWSVGRRLGGGALLLHTGEGRLRREAAGLRDAAVEARQSLFWQGLPHQTLAADLGLVWGSRLDPERAVYLGGFEGLRGYPNHFRSGDRSWTLSLEDRVITPWKLWGIAQVGFVAYADAGAIAAEGAGFGRTWADVGAGLRFGNLKGTVARVVQLTVAVPLVRDEGVAGWQVVAGNTLRF